MGHAELPEFFGSCHDHAKTNAANIEKLADFTEALTEDVFRIRTEGNENFFMVTSELAAINSVQKEMIKVNKPGPVQVGAISKAQK